jgi:hypothetical protein
MQDAPPPYNQVISAAAHQSRHIDMSLPVNGTAADGMPSPTFSDLEIQSFGMSTDCKAI